MKQLERGYTDVMKDNHLAAIGTYSAAETEGIHTVEVDAESGELTILDSAIAGPDPTFVAPHPNGEFLYVASREESEGVIRTYAVDRETGDLNLLNSAASGAVSPCYCSVDATGQFLFVAHYAGGAISMMPIENNGKIGSPSTVREHHGSSIDEERQESPHPHSIVPGPENQFVYVPDLGTDQINVYEIDSENQTLSSQTVIDTPAGSGPRHLKFNPTGNKAYLINELDSTITTFDRQPDGTLTERSIIDTLPESFEGNNKTAEVAVHPSGQFVFGSNRGHDSIVTFEVVDSALNQIDHTSSGGEWPRHFTIDPAGRFLFAENKQTDNITVFRINQSDGTLSPAGESLSVLRPVCMQWIQS